MHNQSYPKSRKLDASVLEMRFCKNPVKKRSERPTQGHEKRGLVRAELGEHWLRMALPSTQPKGKELKIYSLPGSDRWELFAAKDNQITIILLLEPIKGR